MMNLFHGVNLSLVLPNRLNSYQLRAKIPNSDLNVRDNCVISKLLENEQKERQNHR